MMAMLALADDRGDCGRRQLLPTCRGRMGGTEVVHMVADARAWWRRTVHDARTVHGRCACAGIAGGGGQRAAVLRHLAVEMSVDEPESWGARIEPTAKTRATN